MNAFNYLNILFGIKNAKCRGTSKWTQPETISLTKPNNRYIDKSTQKANGDKGEV